MTSTPVPKPAALLSARASAPEPARPPEDVVTVAIRSDAGVHALHVEGHGADSSPDDCWQSCTLELVPGTYTLSFSSGTKATSRTFTVSGPTAVTVSSGSGLQRGIGVGLLVAGDLTFLFGLDVLWAEKFASSRESRPCAVDSVDCYTSPGWDVPVAIATASGLGVGVVGLWLYLAAQPGIRVSAAKVAAAAGASSASSRFRLTPELGSRRNGVRLEWSF